MPVLLVSGIDRLWRRRRSRAYAAGNRTLAFLGASGVGKSTLVNALLDDQVMDTRRGARRRPPRPPHHGRRAAAAVAGRGWLIDTPGVRAVSLWLSGRGIERAFADVFELMDHCRFRDCKHDREPGCAVQAAVEAGELDPARLASLERLVAEEAALEVEQTRGRRKLDDQRGHRR